MEARFDTRLPKEQKELFEKAALLGGFRNLTDFVISSLNDRARQIIDNHEKIIASQKDREIFFDALMNPSEPNNNLLVAVDNFFDELGK